MDLSKLCLKFLSQQAIKICGGYQSKEVIHKRKSAKVLWRGWGGGYRSLFINPWIGVFLI